MAEDEEERNSLLLRVKEESEKAGLKLNIKKENKTKKQPKITASSPITSSQKVESMANFLFLDSKITAEGDYSCEIRR